MKPYKVRRSKIDNLGLYATKNVKKGAKIIEYKGKVLQEKSQKKILNTITTKLFIFLT